jgi:hypothetical protein
MRKAVTPGSLYRLIYRSREVIAQVAPDSVTEAGLHRELRAIVSVARCRNTEDNITGALLFTGTGFAQILEGRREVLERTFDRIAMDRRHTDVAILSFTPTPQRSFSDWPMGFCGQAQPGSPELFAHPSDTGTLSGARITTGSDVLRFLEKLIQQEDAWSVA